MKFREITANQLAGGYYVKVNGGILVQRQDFQIVQKTERGTYIVVDPASVMNPLQQGGHTEDKSNSGVLPELRDSEVHATGDSAATQDHVCESGIPAGGSQRPGEDHQGVRCELQAGGSDTGTDTAPLPTEDSR